MDVDILFQSNKEENYKILYGLIMNENINDDIKFLKPIKKMPLDAKIIGYFMIAIAVLIFILLIASIYGNAHIPSNYRRPVLFGLFYLDSDFTFRIHGFIVGILNLISGFGIIKGLKIIWWITLFSCIYGILDSIFTFNYSCITASISICMGIFIISWLIFRRKLYGIISR